jgi:hypothetical protein
MKNQNLKLWISIAATAAVAFNSCKKESTPSDTVVQTPTYKNGVIITNEGSFNNGTGTVGFFSNGTKHVTADVFQKENNRPIGNVLQSATLINSKIYFVVNNANKIEVTDATTLKSTGTINISQPRYMISAGNGKAYITQWKGSANGVVAIVDLATNTVMKTITCGVAPEGMIQKGNYIYIANSGFYPNNDSTVTVIDIVSESSTTTINVGPNPSAMAEGADGKIWVLCNGNGGNGMFVKIDPTSNSVEQTENISSSNFKEKFFINKNKTALYCNMYDGVYKLDLISNTVSNFIPRNIYGLGYDSSTDIIYCSDVRDYISNGQVIRYNSYAAAIDSFDVGIIPGNFLMNY